jgi:hypothetical protein
MLGLLIACGLEQVPNGAWWTRIPMTFGLVFGWGAFVRGVYTLNDITHLPYVEVH